MKKHLLLFLLSAIIYVPVFAQPASRATLTSTPFSWINRQVPTTTNLNRTFASFWNIVDDGTPLIGTTGWKTTGNVVLSGTTNHFFGSTNNASILFYTNNSQKMKLDSVGALTIGSASTAVLTTTYNATTPAIYMGTACAAPTLSNYFVVHSNNGPQLNCFDRLRINVQDVTVARFGGSGLFIGGNSGSSAYLHLAASNATLPAILLTSGTDYSVATNGSMWYNTTTGFNFRGTQINGIGNLAISGTSSFSNAMSITRSSQALVTNLSILSGTGNVSAYQINTDGTNSLVAMDARNSYSLSWQLNDVSKMWLSSAGFSIAPTTTFNAGVRFQADATLDGTKALLFANTTIGIGRNYNGDGGNDLTFRYFQNTYFEDANSAEAKRFKIESGVVTANIFSVTTTSTLNTVYNNGNAFTAGTSKIGSQTAVTASALLECTSTSLGFLPPRMTATQGSAIATPAEGLMIYVTDTNGTFTAKGWWGYDGAAWQKLNN